MKPINFHDVTKQDSDHRWAGMQPLDEACNDAVVRTEAVVDVIFRLNVEDVPFFHLGKLCGSSSNQIRFILKV